MPTNSPQLNQSVSDGIEKLKLQHFVTLEKLYQNSINEVNDDYSRIFARAVAIFEERNSRRPQDESDFRVVSIIATAIRERIISSIENNKNEVKSIIEQNYNAVQGINDEVTSYLSSAANLSQETNSNRNQLSNFVGFDLNLEKQLMEFDKNIEDVINGELQK